MEKAIALQDIVYDLHELAIQVELPSNAKIVLLDTMSTIECVRYMT